MALRLTLLSSFLISLLLNGSLSAFPFFSNAKEMFMPFASMPFLIAITHFSSFCALFFMKYSVSPLL
jgi:hypothetical protein